ncbi:hypothetical protein ACFVUQ_04950 [Streptomyces cyaneofuscatus]|uniref:hypothetical protein n=1 Tax=Streptomyces cyaneofuscatus TaxID=66883 RepID=UPI0036D7C1F1
MPDQFGVVELPFDGRYLVTGPQASGKTATAIYRAWAQATAGHNTALITHSNILSQYIEFSSSHLAKDVYITTFHRWLREFWNINFQEDPPTDGMEQWTYDWPKMQLDCFHRRPNHLNTLVIDEGQNLPPQFYELCNILKNPMTVFADSTAGVEEGQTPLADIERKMRPTDTVNLQGNHRSSREIATLAENFIVKPAPNGLELPTRSGEIPHLMHCSSARPFIPQLAQYVSSHPECSIGIICRTTELQREIHLQLSRLGFHSSVQSYISDDINRSVIDFAVTRVFVVNVASMKGLEFDIVFVPDLDSYTEDPTSASAREQLQTLCMRARNELHFIYQGHQEPGILAGISTNLLGRRTI